MLDRATPPKSSPPLVAHPARPSPASTPETSERLGERSAFQSELDRADGLAPGPHCPGARGGAQRGNAQGTDGSRHAATTASDNPKRADCAQSAVTEVFQAPDCTHGGCAPTPVTPAPTSAEFAAAGASDELPARAEDAGQAATVPDQPVPSSAQVQIVTGSGFKPPVSPVPKFEAPAGIAPDAPKHATAVAPSATPLIAASPSAAGVQPEFDPANPATPDNPAAAVPAKAEISAASALSTPMETPPATEPTAAAAAPAQVHSPPSPPPVPATLASPPAETATPARMALHEPTPAAAVPVLIASMARDGARRFDIRLDPEELGRVDVRIEIDKDGQVRTHLIVERPEALAILRREASTLQQALGESGLRTEPGGVQVSLRQGSEGQHNSGYRQPTPPSAPAEPGGSEMPATPDPMQGRRLRLRSALDITL